jgi:sporulation protein YlmC with PRC-barrel domain
MPMNLKRLIGRTVNGTDGKIGRLLDALLDDREWKVRYLVVSTGFWPFRRRVVVLPKHVTGLPAEGDTLEVNLTKDEVKKAPPLSRKQPVSQVKEKQFHDYYQVPVYWSGTAAWEETYDPGAMPKSGDHLIGYGVKAADEPVGKLTDMLFDTEEWQTARFIIHRSEAPQDLWVPADSVREVSWIESAIRLEATVDLNEYTGPEA